MPEEVTAPPRRMDNWRVFETPDGVRHAAGCVYDGGGYVREGRVTSAIRASDAATATLTTGSGRKDRHDREPGLALDSASVFNTFEARAGVVDQTRKVCPKNIGLRWSRRER